MTKTDPLDRLDSGRRRPSRTPWPDVGRVGILAALLALAGAAALTSLGVGAADIGPAGVVATLFGGGDEAQRAVVLGIRLPRTLLGLLVGGALAVAGAVFQALLRNPLADPYVLGVSSGAAVGAVVAMLAGAAWFPLDVEAGALAGALLAMFVVLRAGLAWGSGLDTRTLLLAGVAVGAFFNAVVLLLLTTADAESFRSAVFWMMGSLARAGLADTGRLALFLAPCLLVAALLSRPLNLLATGEESAGYLGVPVERVKQAGYVAASLAVALAVSVVGVIGFVGLIVPHAVRMLWGGDHRFLLPACFLGGAAFLALADTVARTVVAPAELPTGVVTSLIGVPLFVVLLARSGR